MKFRMIFLGAEQDPDGGTVPELDADIPVDESSLRCYEYSGTKATWRLPAPCVTQLFFFFALHLLLFA